MPINLLVAAALAAASVEAPAQTAAVAVIVKVPKPWYAPNALVARRMRDTMVTYAELPGLAHKAYSIAQADGAYGGIYLWRDEAAARAWFSAAWHERVLRERGEKADVRFFAAPVVLDNQAPGASAVSDSRSVATLVSLPIPPGVDRARLEREFLAAIPQYQKVPGLLRKTFIIEADQRFGGIYLWKDQNSAEQWFNDAWHERVRKAYGGQARIEWFDTPILLPGTRADNAVATVTSAP